MYHNDIKHMAQNTWHAQKTPASFCLHKHWHETEFFILLQIWQLNRVFFCMKLQVFKWLQSSWQNIEFWGLNMRLGELLFPKTSFKMNTYLLPIHLSFMKLDT